MLRRRPACRSAPSLAVSSTSARSTFPGSVVAGSTSCQAASTPQQKKSAVSAAGRSGGRRRQTAADIRITVAVNAIDGSAGSQSSGAVPVITQSAKTGNRIGSSVNRQYRQSAAKSPA